MSAPHVASVRVLVCDDDQVLSAAVATLIDYTAGMELVGPPVRSGQGAIDAVGLHHPDVVLMDVDLVGRMDGFEATKIIRERAPETHVVIMSGMPDVIQATHDAHAAGASHFLPKAELTGRVLDAVRSAAHSDPHPADPC